MSKTRSRLAAAWRSAKIADTGSSRPARRVDPIKFSATVQLAGASLSFNSSSAPATAVQADLETLERELAELFVSALNLEVVAAEIDPTAPIYGDGLGLDSIDILEVSLEISHRYGFQLRSDDENNERIFRSLRSLAAHVALHRVK
jgi:acyl carrier protein